MAIKENFEELSKEITKLSNKFNKELVEKKTQVDYINSELDRQLKSLEDIQEKEKNINSNLNKKNSKLVDLDKQIFDKNQAANLLKDLKSEISSATLDKNHLLEEIIGINRKITEISNELSQMSKDKETSLSELRNLDKEKTVLFTNIQSYTKELNAKERVLDEIISKSMVVGEEILDSKRILTEMNDSIDTKKIELSVINDNIAIAKSNKEELDGDMENMSSKIDNSNSILEDIKTKCEVEKNKISHERDRLLSVRKEILQTIMNNRKLMDSNKLAEFIKSVREDDDSGCTERTDKE